MEIKKSEFTISAPRVSMCPKDTKAEYINLNGTWKFKYVAGTSSWYSSSPGSSEFQAKDYDDSGWGTIRVPLSWEMANHGKPVYTKRDLLCKLFECFFYIIRFDLSVITPKIRSIALRFCVCIDPAN